MEPVNFLGKRKKNIKKNIMIEKGMAEEMCYNIKPILLSLAWQQKNGKNLMIFI